MTSFDVPTSGSETSRVSVGHGVLVVDGVTAGYGGGVVVRGVDLDVGKGSIAVLLGRNGVGKSTLARCIAGTLPLSGGRVLLHGEVISGLSPDHRARLGVSVAPQGKRVFPSLSVSENLLLGRLTLKRRRLAGADTSLAWSTDRVMELFPVFGQRLGTRAANTSGGEQQMLALARLMVGGPSVLVLDEPSEALSPVRVSELGWLLSELRTEGMTTLLIEQNLEFALGLADKVYVMDHGEIVLELEGDAIRSERAHIESFLTL